MYPYHCSTEPITGRQRAPLLCALGHWPLKHWRCRC